MSRSWSETTYLGIQERISYTDYKSYKKAQRWSSSPLSLVMLQMSIAPAVVTLSIVHSMAEKVSAGVWNFPHLRRVGRRRETVSVLIVFNVSWNTKVVKTSSYLMVDTASTTSWRD